MSKVELLCPAGSYEAFEAALYNGADAIFLAGHMYGARASAANFSLEEMRRAVSLAHLYGVRIHVTLNTLIHDSELEACRNYLRELDEMGVDALIVQDLGIMNLIRHEFPNLKIHASTQMHIHNKEGVKQCRQWGLQRCVVARESSLETIKEMCRCGIEIEVFVQGAYCVSYSGECHMSRNIGSRSANRGECAQSCRLPYTLYKITNGKEEKLETKGKYLLSLKDLNALPLVGELIESGVASFKIEGRMKRPEYVACMCRIYRQAIDAYYEGRQFDINENLLDEMKKIFNRGFTSGYLEKKEGLSIMSTLRPNHQGIRIGKVIGFHHDKMVLSLEKELHQHDGIRILNDKEDQGFIVNYIYKKGKLVSYAARETIELQKVKCQVGDIVMKTSDAQQLAQLSKISKKQRKIPVSLYASFKLGQPLCIRISDKVNEVQVCSDILVERALNVSLSAERVQTQLEKLGNTPFMCEHLQLEMDEDCSFPIAQLNECRREACERLMEMRMQFTKKIVPAIPYKPLKTEVTHQIHVCVLNEQQYEIVKQYPVEIYLTEALYEKHKYAGSHVYRDYPRVTHRAYKEGGRIHDVGGLCAGNYASPYMNCMNAYSAYALFQEGIKCISLSYECRDDDIERLVKNYERLAGYPGNFEVEVYGRVENMVLKNCVIKSQLQTSDHCQKCHHDAYYLRDVKNKSYRLMGDEDCHMKVYHSDVFDKIDRIADYRKMGITNFGICFTFEDEKEVKKVMNRIFNAM